MIGWRMLLWLLVALGLALGAAWSLLSVDDGGNLGRPISESQGGASEEEIGDDSRRALRDLLREMDSESGD